MNQKQIVSDFCEYLNGEINNKDWSEIDAFLEDYEDEEEVYDLVDSVKLKVITQEEYDSLLEFKFMYEGLG